MAGFLPGSRGSFMLDLVALAMFAVLPALALGVNLVKQKRNYVAHKKLMVLISSVLAIAVLLFEIEMRTTGWRHLAEPSPYYESLVPMTLSIHLACSITTTLLLVATVSLALKLFPAPPQPNSHSSLHKALGKSAAIGLVLTSITGWIFYYIAFIAA